MSDVKYFLAYSIPLSAIVGMEMGGVWSFTTVLYSFGFIPIWEAFLKPNPEKLNEEKIQKSLLKNKKQGFFSLYNDFFFYQLFQLFYLAFIGSLFGIAGVLFAVAIAVVAVLLLETINYIEHYGLLRTRKGSRYERVTPMHSWNSNHTIGRLVLYELTRHSDHHHRATKKYQILESIEESPQLPFGYTTSMLIAFFPPLWFKLMNKRIPKNY